MQLLKKIGLALVAFTMLTAEDNQIKGVISEDDEAKRIAAEAIAITELRNLPPIVFTILTNEGGQPSDDSAENDEAKRIAAEAIAITTAITDIISLWPDENTMASPPSLCQNCKNPNCSGRRGGFSFMLRMPDGGLYGVYLTSPRAEAGVPSPRRN